MKGKLVTTDDLIVQIELFIDDNDKLKSIGIFDINPKYKNEIWFIQNHIDANAEVLIDCNQLNRTIAERALDFVPDSNDVARLQLVLKGMFYKKI